MGVGQLERSELRQGDGAKWPCPFWLRNFLCGHVIGLDYPFSSSVPSIINKNGCCFHPARNARFTFPLAHPSLSFPISSTRLPLAAFTCLRPPQRPALHTLHKLAQSYFTSQVES